MVKCGVGKRVELERKATALAKTPPGLLALLEFL